MQAASTLLFSSQYRRLILSLTRREVAARFRGSFLGMLWALILPLTMLAIYGFVFGVVFKARWGVEAGVKGEFTVILFAGLLLHGLLAEILMKSPVLMIANANFVKKVVFPLEILPIVAVFSAVFQFLVGFVVLLAGAWFVYGTLPLTLLLAPLIVLPFLLLLLGVSWFLSAFGVYLRDISQMTGVAVTLLLFFSTIFYPASRLPEKLQPLVYLNPLSFIVDELRGVALAGHTPHWQWLAVYFGIALFIAAAGLCTFQKLRKGFADAL